MKKDALMPEEIYSDLFRIRIPLPGSPLKYLNSYLIRSDDRSLLVDTGLNREECKTAMIEGLSRLGVDLSDIDIFITHLHADHFGLIKKLAGPDTIIYFNRPDAEIIENWQGFEPMIRYAARNGFSEQILRAAIEQHPGYRFGTDWVPEMSILKDEERIKAGRYTFSCIHTPGHTRGHTCLYEPDRKFLIAGDHILYDITPNIQCWSDTENPLRDYLESLDKIYGLPVERVLPGHRSIFKQYRERIDALKSHHYERLEEVFRILSEESPQTAFSVASKMTWDIVAESWQDFPVAQKWFATGEAISHLRYLEAEGRIVRTEKDGIIRFSPA